jgi:hypothetical protein
MKALRGVQDRVLEKTKQEFRALRYSEESIVLWKEKKRKRLSWYFPCVKERGYKYIKVSYKSQMFFAHLEKKRAL